MHHALQFLAKTITPVWRAHDREAVRHQRIHRSMARVAIVCGTVALVVSIIQGVVASSTPLLQTLEIASAVLAGVSVAAGLLLGFHHRWLAARQIAERLRNLKFQALAADSLWRGKHRPVGA